MNFKVNSIIIHLKTGKIYRILALPDKMERLEHNDAPFYKYQSFSTGIKYYRDAKEMEDGRFMILRAENK